MNHELQPRRKRAPAREIFGWAMFDFANQSYTLLIISVVFGTLFTQVVVGDRGDDFRLGNLLWTAALAISYLLVAASAPVMGAIMDFTATKKRFLFGSYLLTVATTALLYFVAPGYILLGMLLIILSNYAYSVGEAFIASFLPDLGPPEDLGKISGLGWSFGYVGGLVSAGFTILHLGDVSVENFERIRWVGPFAAVFFLLAAIPTFVWLREHRTRQILSPGERYLAVGIRRLVSTFENVRQFRDLMVFFGSLFFMMAGLYILISFTFIYGAQVIGWDEVTRNTMFIVVQVTAAIGAVTFGFAQDRFGAKLIYNITLLLWIVAIAAIYFTPELTRWLNRTAGLALEEQELFIVVGSLAGLSLGSSQSAGRALVGVLSPRHKAAEFFGFWKLTMMLAAVSGLLGMGALQMLIGLRNAMLFCAALFAVAILVCLLVDEMRGRRNAELHEQWERKRT